MPDPTCAKCNAVLDPGEAREYLGQELCEVHTAKSLKDLPGGQTLTPLQQRFYDLVKERGEVPMLEAAAHLGLTEDELRREFAPLRHMEMLRGCKKENLVYLTLF
jgi:hypothetical protein